MIRKLSRSEKYWQIALANGWAFNKNLYLLGWREAPKTQAALASALQYWWITFATFGMPEGGYLLGKYVFDDQPSLLPERRAE